MYTTLKTSLKTSVLFILVNSNGMFAMRAKSHVKIESLTQQDRLRLCQNALNLINPPAVPKKSFATWRSTIPGMLGSFALGLSIHPLKKIIGYYTAAINDKVIETTTKEFETSIHLTLEQAKKNLAYKQTEVFQAEQDLQSHIGHHSQTSECDIETCTVHRQLVHCINEMMLNINNKYLPFVNEIRRRNVSTRDTHQKYQTALNAALKNNTANKTLEELLDQAYETAQKQMTSKHQPVSEPIQEKEQSELIKNAQPGKSDSDLIPKEKPKKDTNSNNDLSAKSAIAA